MTIAKVKKIINEIFLLLITLLFIFPLYYCIINAFKLPEEISRHPFTIWFDTFTFSNIVNFFVKAKYLRTFMYTASITVTAVFVLILFCSMASYPLARLKNKIFKYYYLCIVAAIVLPFEVALIPLIVILKNLHLMYNIFGVALVHIAWNAPFAIFLYTGFMRTIPRELEESATVDGCGMFRTYFTILLPLLQPITAACIILLGLWIWNDFLVAYVALNASNQLTLQVSLYYSLGKYMKQYNLLFAGMILVSLPVTIMFLSMQKHFIKGITAGAVKG
jgi:raffinose/stachyose/melibiose transport system permease protein